MSAMADLDAETAGALLLLRKRVLETDDPVSLAGYLAQVGEFVLSRLGFDMDKRADVQIHIGTDEEPDVARIVLTWPLPPEVRTAQDEERYATAKSENDSAADLGPEA